MGFIERVLGEVDHVVIDPVGRLRRDPLCRASRYVLLRIAVDKIAALLLHDLLFFLAHRPSDEIRASERIAAEVLHDLHDLLLVDDTPVGRCQDRLELLCLVADLAVFLFSLDILGNKVHRARAVQRDPCNDILQVTGF